MEKVASEHITHAQRGFIKGRSMLRNVLDLDSSAKEVRIKHKSGTILLFDFKAAFPSLNQEFMWDALAAFGIPRGFVSTCSCSMKTDGT